MLSTFCLHKLSNFARLLKIYWQLLIVALKENRAIFYRSKNTHKHTHTPLGSGRQSCNQSFSHVPWKRRRQGSGFVFLSAKLG